MPLLRRALVYAVLASSLSADTLSLWQTGGQLVFHFSAASYRNNAAFFGVPANPTSLQFLFLSEAGGAGAQVAASLETLDGSLSLLLPGFLDFVPGTFMNGGNSLPVSTLGGAWTLPGATSARLFDGSAEAILRLTNFGEDMIVGLPPYSLRDDLQISLGGGNLSAGALVLSVDAPLAPTATSVPEPSFALLLLAGAVVLALSVALRCRLQPVSGHCIE